MITQLQALEQTIVAMKKKYAVTATELANLKQKVANDNNPQLISKLQAQLDTANQDLSTHLAQISELQTSRDALQSQIEQLVEQNQQLSEQNQDLKEKNELAIARAEIIRNWLAQIDHQDR